MDWFIIVIIVTLLYSFVNVTLYQKIKKLERENKELRKKQLKPHKRLPRDIDYLILEMYSKGYSLRQIAREIGVSHTTVHRRLKKIINTLDQPIPRPIQAINEYEQAETTA